MKLLNAQIKMKFLLSTKNQVYKAKVDDFQDTKASVLGEYVPSKLNMEEGEEIAYIAVFSEYKGYMILLLKTAKSQRWICLPMKQNKSEKSL